MLKWRSKWMLVPLCGIIALFSAIGVAADSGGKGSSGAASGANGADDVVRLGVDVVSLNITVVDATGKFIRGLGQDAFDVYEDKVRQRITYFSREDAPVSLGVVFDRSGSMKEKIASAHAAIKEFLAVCRDDDDIFTLGFNQEPKLLHDYTSDDGSILNSIATLQPNGRTAVIDGIFVSLAKLREGRHARRALLLISDGQDNSSRYTMNELKDAVMESDVQIYCIGVAAMNGLQNDTDREGFDMLAELAELTGGKAFYPRTPAELEAVCSYIALTLRSQYSLGYESTNLARDGKWRDVRVRVHVPNWISSAAVRCRTGYYALGLREK